MQEIINSNGTINDEKLIDFIIRKELKLLICSAGGGGKDFLRDRLKSKGLKPEVSYTSRLPREGEKDGYTYWFVTHDQFKEMISNGEFLQYEYFKPVQSYYGTHLTCVENYDIFIMTPPAIKKLVANDYRKRFLVLYLDIPEEVRRERLSKRKNFDVNARIENDKEEIFKDFIDYDIRVTNPFF